MKIPAIKKNKKRRELLIQIRFIRNEQKCLLQGKGSEKIFMLAPASSESHTLVHRKKHAEWMKHWTFPLLAENNRTEISGVAWSLVMLYAPGMERTSGANTFRSVSVWNTDCFIPNEHFSNFYTELCYHCMLLGFGAGKEKKIILSFIALNLNFIGV